jgi:CRISPR-associated protein Csb1
MNSAELVSLLNRAVRSGVSAIRAITLLEPADGPGGRVAPPTYEGGAYAYEDRRLNGEVVKTVILDSIQSQANRFEEVLYEAFRNGQLSLPVFEMQVGSHEISSLTVPHRVHDAILRDSLWNGTAFRESANGKRLIAARAANATPFYEFAPTVLLFGSWDSQGGGGVNTAKLARAMVSEIIAYNVVPGKKTASRIDPLGIKRGVQDLIVKDGRDWKLGDGKSKKGTVRPSEINHGNVTPTISDGGVTFDYAEQTTVLSFTQLRKLRFPANGGGADPERDAAGRAVVGALGLCALTLQWEDGFQLRSRCQLVPTKNATLEVIGRTTKERESFELESSAAQDALQQTVQGAEKHGLTWHAGRIELQPRADLVKLVEYSDQLMEPAAG